MRNAITVWILTLAACGCRTIPDAAPTPVPVPVQGPAEIPRGLTRVARPAATDEEAGRVRALIRQLSEGGEARASAAAALLALDWKAVPQLEGARWASSYPLSVFVEAVLSEMPLSAWARDGEYIREKDGAVMVWVPPGDIPMPDWAVEKGMPARPVRIDGFFIDRFCVTNRMFARFLNETHQGSFSNPYLPKNEPTGLVLERGSWRHRPGYGNHPAWDFVGWVYGRYARWAWASLPTAAMWERAAGAGDGRAYPWGNDACTPLRAQTEGSPINDTVPVWWFPHGDSPSGCRQMTGNVLEYTWDISSGSHDVYLDENGANPIALDEDPDRIIRRILKGGGVDEGEDAYDIRKHKIFCSG